MIPVSIWIHFVIFSLAPENIPETAQTRCIMIYYAIVWKLFFCLTDNLFDLNQTIYPLIIIKIH